MNCELYNLKPKITFIKEIIVLLDIPNVAFPKKVNAKQVKNIKSILPFSFRKPISINNKVKFTIKDKTYIKTTNNKGQAKLTINLKAGKKYTVKVGFKSTSKYGTTTLTKQIKVIR